MSKIIGTDALETLRAHANIDALYGPYSSKLEAYESLYDAEYGDYDYVTPGLTVGIWEEGKIVEYQWKKQPELGLRLTVNDLERKEDAYTISIDSVTSTLNTDANTITFGIKVSGKGFGVQTNIYLGASKIASESTILGSVQNFVIQAPENPGNYVYTIKVVDTILNNGVESTLNITWKEVDAKISATSSIYNYKVKSLENLLNAEFSFQVYKVDTVTVTGVSILYGSHTVPLTLNPDGYYNVIIRNDLPNLASGDTIQIKIEGTGLTETFIKDVVRLTAAGVYSNIQGTIPTSAFNNQSFSATLYFEAETEGNYLVVIKDRSDSNKIVYNSSLLSYTNNILTLKLEDTNLDSTNRQSLHLLDVYIENLNVNWGYRTLTLVYFANEELLEPLTGDGNEFSRSLDFSSMQGTKTLQSYILDLNCYIPYTTDLDPVFKLGNQITINKDLISFAGSITYPTPLQLNVSIGFMRNVTSSGYYYDALFINGVLCTKNPLKSANAGANFAINNETEVIDTISNNDGIRFYYNVRGASSQDPESFVLETNYKARNPQVDVDSLPIFKIVPLTNYVTKAQLTAALIENISNGKVTIDGTEYSVIDTTDFKVGTFGNLGDTKYEINNLLSDFCTAYNVTLTTNDETIAALSKKVKKDVSKIPNGYLTLTRQIVKSKKLLQKYVAVPCQWKFGQQTGLLLAYTQGTSTLVYALPNFTFKFYQADNTFSTKVNVSIIPKINRSLTNMLSYSTAVDNNTEYFTEKELVAKADYMESSHLNNTPTAMFYNAITTLQSGYETTDSNDQTVTILLNPVPGKLNAIEGIPIVIEIAESLNTEGINYGSFMLNIPKAGSSIGFGSQGISLEGTSNAVSEGQASRFDFASKDIAARTYIEGILDIDNENTVNQDFVDFIQEGLEYRYSGKGLGDIGEESEDDATNSEYKRILKMWHWVYTNTTYTKSQFEEMFNFEFAALYYIQMMIFGQTDNLGKNCMFDLFTENGQWYVRPYDMDSQAGLDNNGYDLFSPVIEINKQFVLDLATKDIETFTYLGQEDSLRFPYSSKTSNLWIRFYLNLKSDIEKFYKLLRDLGYSVEAVLSLCQKEVIDKLGINQYNRDFKNKYLTNESTNPYEQFAYGNRWVRFKDWMEKRFDFCDTYFGYNVYEAGTSGTTQEFTIHYSLPQYTNYAYNDQTGGHLVTNWGTSCTLNFQSITKQTITFSPKYIIDDNLIFQKGFTSIAPRVKLNNLTTYSGSWSNLINVVDLSENTYMQTMSIRDINTSNSLGVIPKSTKVLNITSSSTIPSLTDYANLERVSFSNCSGNITLENCRNLKNLSISSCNNVNLTLINCGNSTTKINVSISSSTFNQVVLNGSYINYLGFAPQSKLNISFTGEKSYLNTLNLYQCTLLNKQLNISNLEVNNLILNYISECAVIVNEAKSYTFLGLKDSKITQWGTTAETFDGSKFSNINAIRMIEPSSDDSTTTGITSTITEINNGTYTSTIGFRLINCTIIKYVINLNVNTTARALFQNCTSLISVTDSNITAAPAYMFSMCYNLETLPTSGGNSTITLQQNSLDTELSLAATDMFNSCQKLTYAQIEQVLNNNIVTRYWNSSTNQYQATSNGAEAAAVSACKITDYTGFLANKGYSANTTINLSKYVFATRMDGAFRTYNWSAASETNKNTETVITLTFIGIIARCATSVSTTFAAASNYKYILPDNVFNGCSLLTNMDYCFYAHRYLTGYFRIPVLPDNADLSLISTCALSKVDITNLKDSGLIYLPSNIRTCAGMFYNATLSEGTEPLTPIEVKQIFSRCNLVDNVTNCFRACNNIQCSGPLELGSSNFVNIAGVFSMLGENGPTIYYGFTNHWYSDPLNSQYRYGQYGESSMPNSQRVGPYYNTIVTFGSTDPSISISQSGNASSPSHIKRNLLEGAIIDNNESVITITLSIAAEKIDKICRNIRARRHQSDTRSTIKVVLNTGVTNAEEAFNCTGVTEEAGSLLKLNLESTINNQPIALPTTLVNAKGMFGGSRIEKLPTGFNACSGLSDTSYMFSKCINLKDKIPTTGSFFLPISVTNINYMFDYCYGLYGGIPSTFMEVKTVDGETQKTLIASLVRVFSGTAVLLDNTQIEYPALNISEMFPEVKDVTGLFYFHGTVRDNALTYYQQELHTSCFSNCVDCNNLFNSALITLPNNIDFSAAKNMKFAFATGLSSSRNITAILSSLESNYELTDITGLFSVRGGSEGLLNSEVLSNLVALSALKEIAPIYIGMLYGYGNDYSVDEYKYVQSPANYDIQTYMHA